MKVTNACWGYDVMPTPKEKERWYYHPVFPLLPIFHGKKKDKYNAFSFGFSWLFIRIWTLDSLFFSVCVELDQIGLSVCVTLFYCKLVLRILPLPYGWLTRFDRV